MKIAHFAPFAPHRAGLYETTRDMIKAERMLGHTVDLVDNGVDGKRHIGAEDNRHGCEIKTVDYKDVREHDIFVVNQGITQGFLSETMAPVVHIMHGRPLSSFRLNQRDKKKSPVYDIYSKAAHSTRVKMFISLWPEHIPYWRVIIPDSKLRTTKHPPCDLEAFTPDGPVHEFEKRKGKKFNILVCDLWRPDTDPFEIANGLCELARTRDDFLVNFYACSNPIGPWQHIFNRLAALGALGEVKGMMLKIDEVYRAADLMVTPHRIATRTIRECLACGTIVIGPNKSQYFNDAYTGIDEHNPQNIAQVISGRLDFITKKDRITRNREQAAVFGLDRFGPEIIKLYEEAIGG